jgi:hypothetical protein
VVPVSSGASAVVAAVGTSAPRFLAASESNLQLTSPLVWVLVAISAAGAIVTFAFLVYAVVKFRDPATKGRRYG